ncbi:major facilitator superfamily domain-containing protein [Hypoxylon fragiforme]|uniref:major facilitator superfamily domain-containing protein n=1 Tax=Hypoxylon fragiforme TaxID=63214 RepID=UPI0020C64BFC|nr:major facilitator superfamily domain-containing protein [Hypoxylon fragiforme]KAI2605834.1 major facilitator superfamily domain-containing protein [Hypoxylon fragiforme]
MSNPPSEKGDPERAISNETTISKDGEATTTTASAAGLPNVAELAQPNMRGLRAPEIIARLSPEQRVELETRLRKKIDLRLLPMLILMYILNYIDRNNIAAAKLAGLPEDLNLDPNASEFQTAVSILFVGYLLMQIPSNLFLNKIGKPALYLPACMMIWGVISAATAAVTNFGGLIAVRFFLGFVEAAYFPGCLYYLSCWYTRKELGLRTAMLYSGALISGAFSGLMSAGITQNMNGARGFSAWQWLFIIEGVITIGISFIAFFILPNFPRTTSWLTEEEKALAIWRLEEDIGEDDWIDSEHQSLWQGARLAFTDVKTWVLLVLLFGIVASGSVTNFFPAVVKTLGYNNVVTLLLTCPPYVLCVIATFINAWHADRTGERYWHITLSLVVALAAFILAAATTDLAPRYVAMMLMVPGVYCAFVVALAWISNTLPRPPAKRAAALAFINAVSNASSIYASYMYEDRMAPRYVIAMSVNCGTTFMAIVAATVMRIMLVRLNRKLDAGEFVEGAVNALPGEAVLHGFRFKV